MNKEKYLSNFIIVNIKYNNGDSRLTLLEADTKVITKKETLEIENRCANVESYISYNIKIINRKKIKFVYRFLFLEEALLTIIFYDFFLQLFIFIIIMPCRWVLEYVECVLAKE